jgi:hypothetical protein
LYGQHQHSGRKNYKKEMQPSLSSTPAGGSHGSYRLIVILIIHLDLVLHLDVVFLLLKELAAQGFVIDLDEEHIIVVALEHQDVALA